MRWLPLKVLPPELAKHFPHIGHTFDNHNRGDEGKRAACNDQADCPEKFPNFHHCLVFNLRTLPRSGLRRPVASLPSEEMPASQTRPEESHRRPGRMT